MADLEWTGTAGTGDFGTAANWQNVTTGQTPAPAAPGPADDATITGNGLIVTGSGGLRRLVLKGDTRIAGALDVTTGGAITDGTHILGHTVLAPQAVLQTLLLNLGNGAGTAGTLVIGEGSRVAIAGAHPAGNFAVSVAQGAGSTGTLLVDGPGALLNGGDEALSVGQDGVGLMRIDNGGLVTAGNIDLGVGFAVAIGNHGGADGTLALNEGSLLTGGAILVGRTATGTLDIGPSSLIAAGNMLIGITLGSFGTVAVHGDDARLALAGTLEIGGQGTGALSVMHGGVVSVGVVGTVNGGVTLDTGDLVATTLTVTGNGGIAGTGNVLIAGTLSNYGAIEAGHVLTVSGALENDGALGTAANSTLDLVGTLSGAGTIAMAKGATVALGTTAAGQTVVFAGTGATLVLRNPGGFAGTVQGFGVDDRIVVEGIMTTLTIVNGIITLSNATGPVAQVRLVGAYTAANLPLSVLPGGRSVIKYHP